VKDGNSIHDWPIRKTVGQRSAQVTPLRQLEELSSFFSKTLPISLRNKSCFPFENLLVEIVSGEVDFSEARKSHGLY
jgi:hypothetical protein